MGRPLDGETPWGAPPILRCAYFKGVYFKVCPYFKVYFKVDVKVELRSILKSQYITMFYTVLHGFTAVLHGFYTVLYGFTRFYTVLHLSLIHI